MSGTDMEDASGGWETQEVPGTPSLDPLRDPVVRGVEAPSPESGEQTGL